MLALRGFLSTLANGADLAAALRVGAAHRSPSGRSFAKAKAALAAGQSEDEALRYLDVPPVVVMIVARAPADRRRIVAVELLKALRSTDAGADRTRNVRTAVGLNVAAGTAIVGLLIVCSLSYTFGSVDTFGFGLVPFERWLFAGAGASLVGGLLIAGFEGVRTRIWNGDARGTPLEHPRRRLCVLAAAASAGLSIDEAAHALGGTMSHPLARLRGRRPTGWSPSRFFRADGISVDRLEAITKHRWPTESPGAPWARAASLLDENPLGFGEKSEVRAYLSMSLSSVGIGLAVISGYLVIIRIPELGP